MPVDLVKLEQAATQLDNMLAEHEKLIQELLRKVARLDNEVAHLSELIAAKSGQVCMDDLK